MENKGGNITTLQTLKDINKIMLLVDANRSKIKIRGFKSRGSFIDKVFEVIH